MIRGLLMRICRRLPLSALRALENHAAGILLAVAHGKGRIACVLDCGCCCIHGFGIYYAAGAPKIPANAHTYCGSCRDPLLRADAIWERA